jgi:hypothetical protein
MRGAREREEGVDGKERGKKNLAELSNPFVSWAKKLGGQASEKKRHV